MKSKVIGSSVLQELLAAQSHLRSQIYFKASLTALSHAMEDQVLAGNDAPLIVACFQRERFYRQEAHRYQRIANKTSQVYILAAPETEFRNCSDFYETIAFDPQDGLSQEWHLLVLGFDYSACLICREMKAGSAQKSRLAIGSPPMDQARRFEGIWTFDRGITATAARILLGRIGQYRPELKSKLAKGMKLVERAEAHGSHPTDPAPFTDRLVTYLQAGQYKQIKAYRQITIQERKERLTNSITTAIRRSLDPSQILTVAVQELGQAIGSDRCVIYQCRANDTSVPIHYEAIKDGYPSLRKQFWPLHKNPLFQQAVQQQLPVIVTSLGEDPHLANVPEFAKFLGNLGIESLILAPVLYQGRLLGMVELHSGQACPWEDGDDALVEAIATQVGVALIQAEAYADLEDLNVQLEALDRTRSNLIAITGHELRTPLSTIQICLESLASEPDMSLEMRQVMLTTALTDAERMRKLIQDFLTLSQLESGRVQWHPEALPMQELVDLALSSLRSPKDELPAIVTILPENLPLVRADGEWLVEVLSKLIDNACKFTEQSGEVSIAAIANAAGMLEVTVTDTGRGIEPDRLETIFDRFYQEEGALRRSAGGTGLGLAICRQIITNLGGKIWAESAGRDRGSQFHFTIPIAEPPPM
ncbi:ATP-binding protein [Candidatus Synechococcus calcipolaris G9]|uniref:histidine kinase n=1 Tax=Candidatus Synechococcus calcipolaris G9 TaxID=1497997 RepID=A0ABT6EY58_9SYNE|nr:DICT sensory domain-containing protein [Candidatus Synechococcus calcipolaris]MDG2990488.1 ATP-binding protein [Candidatus Synechococcus calcipolaris G9]